MRLFELHKAFEFSLPYMSSFDPIKPKYNRLFNLSDFNTGTECDTITFKKRQLNPDGSNKHEVFRLLREGSVSIDSDLNKLKVSWSVRLDTLYILSSLITLATTILVFIFLQPQALVLFTTFIFTLGFSLGIGYLHILSRIDEINISCLEQ